GRTRFPVERAERRMNKKGEEMINRKLIRPNLSELKDKMAPSHRPQRKQIPPEQTNAEAFYYLKQMNSKTPMVVVLNDGEELRGVIEWYDRTCIKVNREGAPKLLVSKNSIQYMYKDVGDLGHMDPVL